MLQWDRRRIRWETELSELEVKNKKAAQQMVDLTRKARDDRESMEVLKEREKVLKSKVGAVLQKNKISLVPFPINISLVPVHIRDMKWGSIDDRAKANG